MSSQSILSICDSIDNNYQLINIFESFSAMNIFTYWLPSFTLLEIQIMWFLFLFVYVGQVFVLSENVKCIWKMAMQRFIYILIWCYVEYIMYIRWAFTFKFVWTCLNFFSIMICLHKFFKSIFYWTSTIYIQYSCNFNSFIK